MNRCR